MAISVVDNKLTQREVDALQLAADGLRYKDVAFELNLSPTYIKNVFSLAEQKLGADTVAHAVAMALRRKIIT